MNRRALFRVIRALPILVPTAALAARRPLPAPVLLQELPLEGFRYHNGPAVSEQLRPGDPLRLVREPKNLHGRRLSFAVLSSRLRANERFPLGCAFMGYILGRGFKGHKLMNEIDLPSTDRFVSSIHLHTATTSYTGSIRSNCQRCWPRLNIVCRAT